MPFTDGNLHGTDLFDVLQFCGCENNGRRYKVRHREDGELYTMEVIPQNHKNIPTNARDGVLQTMSCAKPSPYLINSKYYFDTETRRYFILDFVHRPSSLAAFISDHCILDKDVLAYIIAQSSHCLSQLHSHKIPYCSLSLENIFITKSGHVKLLRSVFDHTKWTYSERCDLHLAGEDLKEESLNASFHADWIELGNIIVHVLTGNRISLDTMTDEQWVQVLNSGEEQGRRNGLLKSEAAAVISLLANWSNDSDFTRLKELPFFASIDWEKVKTADLSPPQSLLAWSIEASKREDVNTSRSIKSNHAPRLRHTVSLPLSNEPYVTSGYQSSHYEKAHKHIRSFTDQPNLNVEDRFNLKPNLSLTSNPPGEGRLLFDRETLLTRLLTQLKSTKQYLEDSRLQRNRREFDSSISDRPGLQRSHTHIGSFSSPRFQSSIPVHERKTKDWQSQSITSNSAIKAPHFDNSYSTTDSAVNQSLSYQPSVESHFTNKRLSFARSYTDLTRPHIIDQPYSTHDFDTDAVKIHPSDLHSTEEGVGADLVPSNDDTMSVTASRYSHLNRSRETDPYFMSNSLDTNSYGRLSKSAENLLEDLRKASRSNHKLSGSKKTSSISYGSSVSKYDAIEELHGKPLAYPGTKNNNQYVSSSGSNQFVSEKQESNGQGSRTHSRRRRRRKGDRQKTPEVNASKEDVKSRQEEESSEFQTSDYSKALNSSGHHVNVNKRDSLDNNKTRPELREATSHGRSKIPIKRAKQFEILPSKQKLVRSPRNGEDKKETHRNQEGANLDCLNKVMEEKITVQQVADTRTKHHSLLSNEDNSLENPEEPERGLHSKTEVDKKTGNRTQSSSVPSSKYTGSRKTRHSYVEVEPANDDSSDDVFIDGEPPDKVDEKEMLRKASIEFEHDKKTLLHILRKYNVNIGKEDAPRRSPIRLRAKSESEKRPVRQRSSSLSRDSHVRKRGESMPNPHGDDKSNKGTQVTVLKRFGSSPNISTEAGRINSTADKTEVRSSSRGRSDSYSNKSHEFIDTKKATPSSRLSLGSTSARSKLRKANYESTEDGSGIPIANGRAFKMKLTKPEETTNSSRLKKKVTIDEDATYCSDTSIKMQNKDYVRNMDRHEDSLTRFRTNTVNAASIEGEANIRMTRGIQNSHNVKNDKKDFDINARSHRMQKGLQTMNSQDIPIDNSSDSDGEEYPTQVSGSTFRVSKIPTIRRQVSKDELISDKRHIERALDDNNNNDNEIENFASQELDHKHRAWSYRKSSKTSSRDRVETKEYLPRTSDKGRKDNADSSHDTSELIQSLRVLSEKSSSRTPRSSPAMKRKDLAYDSFQGLHPLRTDKIDDESEHDKLQANTLSPQSSFRVLLPSDRSLSQGSESSNPDDEPLGESFNMSGTFKSLLRDDREIPKLAKADSYLSVVQNSDDEGGSHFNELGRIASFHSLRSVDSGLSDLCNNSGGDEDNKEFKDNQVERSDSGVVKDLEKSLRLLRSESTKSERAAELRVSEGEDAEDEEESPRRRTSENEELVECKSCTRMFPTERSKWVAKRDVTCPKCHAKRVERKEAIIELIQTEINYGNDLSILKEEFYSPIKNGGILNQENLTSIFLNLQELIDVNGKLCTKLQKGLEECSTQSDEDLATFEVGKLFLDNADFFQAFELFCSKQKQSCDLLETLQRKSELLKIFLTVSSNQNTKLRRMDLKSFLTMPVQRIMKYPLLLSRIYRATMRDQPDKEAIRKAQRKIEEQITIINEIAEGRPAKLRKTKSSSALNEPTTKDKLVKICAQILNWKVEDTQIALSGSLEVGLGELIGTVFNRKNLRKLADIQAVLCILGAPEIFQWDDMLKQANELQFPAQSDAAEAAVILLKRKVGNKYTLYKDPVILSRCVVCRHEGIPDAFELSPILREPFTFLGNSVECTHWYECLHFLTRDLGTWRQRRKAMANIMIQSMS